MQELGIPDQKLSDFADAILDLARELDAVALFGRQLE
jgi:hypothetical protein